MDLEVADHEPPERSDRAAGGRKPEDHGLKREDDQQQRWKVPNRLDEEGRHPGHQPIGGEPPNSYQDADDCQQRKTHHGQGQGVANPIEEGLPDRRSRAQIRSGDPNTERLIEELEVGADAETSEVVAEVEPEDVENQPRPRPPRRSGRRPAMTRMSRQNGGRACGYVCRSAPFSLRLGLRFEARADQLDLKPRTSNLKLRPTDTAVRTAILHRSTGH